jgi:hypothetical protein
LAGGLCKFFANAEGKRHILHQLLLVQYKQHANLLLSMNNYSQLVINGNDKNKQLILLSQHKLALTARKRLLALKIIGAPIESLKMAPSSI